MQQMMQQLLANAKANKENMLQSYKPTVKATEKN
jgi:hypothetical protein